MSETASLGLRERKRIETRERLERAAVAVVLRDGLEHATIDAISETADVSPRTFFNYFDSKEDAILGVQLVDISDEMVGRHAADADLVSAVIGVLIELMAPSIGGTDLHQERMEIVRKYPELFSRRMLHFTRMTEEIKQAILLLMANDPRFPSSSDPASSPLAESILALCGSTVRTAIKEWVAAGSVDPTETVNTRAISLAREVIEKLR